MRAQLFVLVATLVWWAAASPDAQSDRDRDKDRCDRDCLIGISEQYLDALVAKDPKKAPLAGSTIKNTENGQRLHLGDGLWNSITARGTYKLHVADSTYGQVVTFTTMREAGMPLILAVRLKVEKKKIVEIETLVAHSEGGAKTLETMVQPRAAFERETRSK
jgi:hypothetical protein